MGGVSDVEDVMIGDAIALGLFVATVGMVAFAIYLVITV